jgi:hypothetical protein
MTSLSRLATLMLAKEVTQGTFLTPTDSIPFTKASYEDVTDALRDESVRGNDVVLQGLYPGVQNSTFDIETHAYPDITGHWLRAIIGPDTVTAGVSTTLSSSSSIGATSLSTAASIATNTIIQIDTGNNLEYAKVTAVSGSGPYVLTVTTTSTGSTGLALAHTSGATVVAQSRHVFAQNRTFSTVWPTYSFLVAEGPDVRGFPGQVCAELQLKIDPKGTLTCNPKFIGWPGATQPVGTYAASAVQPLLGWEWNMTNAGGSSTRGLTYDITLKRATEPIWTSDGVQSPREVFAGALECDGAYKAIYENQTDTGLFYNYTQGQATTATIVQPISTGGAQLAIQMSKPGWHKAQVDLGQTYIQASFDISGIGNTTDAGVTQITLWNFRATTY